MPQTQQSGLSIAAIGHICQAQKWILSVFCVFVLQSARHVVHWTKKNKIIQLHLPADLKVLLTGKEHTRVRPPTEKTNPTTHIFLGKFRVVLL